jgi:tRNA pseudouridine38-40 synthase
MEISYDGGGFRGWAKQPGEVTVEGSLEQALKTVLGYSPRLTVAGRTDAGVHAWRQTVSLDLPQGLQPAPVRRSLNALTPAGLVVRSLRPASLGFDARKQALSRSYRYFLWLAEVENPFLRAYSWHVREPLDLRSMSEAAALVVGRHDLTAFTPAETEHVMFERVVSRCRWHRRGRLSWLEIEAPSFLRHMVRVLVGTFVDIGRGYRPTSALEVLLRGAPRSQAGPTAPPQGLFLWRIRYPAQVDGSPARRGAL